MASPRHRKSFTRDLLLGLAALSAGACAPPVPRSPPPPEWTIAGSILFAVTYAGAAVNAVSMVDGNGWVPVLGPLFLAAHEDAYGGTPDVLFIAMMALDAAAQATGLGLGIAGFLTHTQVQVRDRHPSRPTLRFGAGGATLVF